MGELLVLDVLGQVRKSFIKFQKNTRGRAWHPFSNDVAQGFLHVCQTGAAIAASLYISRQKSGTQWLPCVGEIMHEKQYDETRGSMGTTSTGTGAGRIRDRTYSLG